MYEILGISLSSFTQPNDDPGDKFEEINENDFADINEKIQEIEHTDDSDDDEPLNTSQPIKYNNELVYGTLEKGSSLYMKSENNSAQQVVKKPFLKRGAGLSTRFRIPPDAYNLKKLPRYKYQDRLQKTIKKQKGIIVQDEPKAGEKRKSNENPKRTSSDARKSSEVKKSENKENLKPQENVESNELIIPQNIGLKVSAEMKRPPPQPLDIEKMFPKPKEIIEETPKVVRATKSTCWAQILSSNNISDCSIKIDQIISETLDDGHDETNLFQLLEERIKNLEATPSDIMKLLASLKPNDNEDTIVNPDDPLIENTEAVCLHLDPQPEEIIQKIVIDDSEDSDDDDDDRSDHRVRFSDDVEVMQQQTLNDDDANSTILSSDLELTQTSTPNEKQKFEDFKLKMIGRQRQHEELIERSEQLKNKLQEIEREKSNILKMRSNLELDKVQLENERDDFAERMKDERIKMEIELHDERLKLDQQKQKYEKMIREAKNQSSKKEREEITKLKEQIDELKDEMKAKETRHASTSARLRSQVKQLEKENQTLKLELEMAQKDSKRMELENSRLKRDTNSKMLQEINKNIAKLTKPEIVEKPKVPPKKEAPKKIEPVRKKAPPKPIEISSSSESEEEERIKTLNPVKIRISDPKSSKSTSDVFAEMKREIVNSDGSKDIWYPNGNLKKISPDGMMMRMLYYNKDIKETNINEGTVKYYYADNNTWHTTYIDGLEILEYPK